MYVRFKQDGGTDLSEARCKINITSVLKFKPFINVIFIKMASIKLKEA